MPQFAMPRYPMPHYIVPYYDQRMDAALDQYLYARGDGVDFQRTVRLGALSGFGVALTMLGPCIAVLAGNASGISTCAFCTVGGIASMLASGTTLHRDSNERFKHAAQQLVNTVTEGEFDRYFPDRHVSTGRVRQVSQALKRAQARDVPAPAV